MKLNIFISLFLGIGIILNIYNYSLFLKFLSIIWYIASMYIIYAGIKYTYKYHGLQFKLRTLLHHIWDKSEGEVSPLEAISITLGAKVGVGSITGVALCLSFGGLGSIFWMMVISFLVSINTYVECKLGIIYRDKIDNKFIGGPSTYIKKKLGNKYLGYLYSGLIIITYCFFF